VEVETDGYIT
jgi:hypothetical protein